MFPKNHLIDQEILSLEPKTKLYKIGMGKSLFFYVRPNRKIYWRGRYRFEGKENTLSFGAYPEISISEAHEHFDHTKKMLRLGINPSATFREEKKETRKELKRRKVESMFRLDFSENVGLIISRNNKTLSITPEQKEVLRVFLKNLNYGDSK